VLLVAAEWRARALLRALLIDKGIDVRACDRWVHARRRLAEGRLHPRAAVVDLIGLHDPEDTLRTLAQLVPSERVMVLTGSGALPVGAIERLGYSTVLARPLMLREVVAKTIELLERTTRTF